MSLWGQLTPPRWEKSRQVCGSSGAFPGSRCELGPWAARQGRRAPRAIPWGRRAPRASSHLPSLGACVFTDDVYCLGALCSLCFLLFWFLCFHSMCRWQNGLYCDCSNCSTLEKSVQVREHAGWLQSGLVFPSICHHNVCHSTGDV